MTQPPPWNQTTTGRPGASDGRYTRTGIGGPRGPGSCGPRPRAPAGCGVSGLRRHASSRRAALLGRRVGTRSGSPHSSRNFEHHLRDGVQRHAYVPLVRRARPRAPGTRGRGARWHVSRPASSPQTCGRRLRSARTPGRSRNRSSRAASAAITPSTSPRDDDLATVGPARDRDRREAGGTQRRVHAFELARAASATLSA